MEKVTLARYKNTDYTVNYENKRKWSSLFR